MFEPKPECQPSVIEKTSETLESQFECEPLATYSKTGVQTGTVWPCHARKAVNAL